MNMPPPAAPLPCSTSPDLAALLLQRGADPRVLERGRRVAAESGQRLDSVLLQLGLIGERELAESFAALLDTTVVPPARYPDALPDAAAAIAPRFLRNARALPLAIEHGALAVALADPLDRFAADAIAAATGLPVRVEVAVRSNWMRRSTGCFPPRARRRAAAPIRTATRWRRTPNG